MARQVLDEPEIRKDHATIDDLLERWRSRLRDDFTAYRNHVYRVFNIAAFASRADGIELEKLAVAAAFHDVAIWLDDTFDYLEPSVHRAAAYLETEGKHGWLPSIETMIRQHHKVTPWRGQGEASVEAFRRADWLDVCLFALPSRLPRRFLSGLVEVFPRAGFHGRIVTLGLQWAARHPLRPLPMMKI